MPQSSIKTSAVLAVFAAPALIAAGYGIYSASEYSSSASAFSPKQDDGYRIMRTDDGFSPNALVIPLGETVTFVSGGRPSWPASNIHPTHEIYADFDPKRALESGEEWSFTFAREGRFRFHDHLAANAGGFIEVLDARTVARQPTRLHDCEAVPLGEKQGCWDDLLAYTLTKRGFDRAFELFVALYRTEPNVPKACHGWGHALGDAAYDLYARGEGVEFRPETSYCGYGFYHGFLERLVASEGSAAAAYDFCTRVAGEPRNKLTFNNCIHGIGHGATAGIIENPAQWTVPQDVVDKGAAVCGSLPLSGREARDCADGVFNELVLDIFYEEYGLSRDAYLPQGAPFALCEAQEERLRTSCYFEVVGTFEQLFAGDFARASGYVTERIANAEDAVVAMRKLSADFMQSDIIEDDYAPHVGVCRSLRGDLADACVSGMQIGLIAHGEPGREWEKLFPFCASDLLSEEERAACFRKSFYHFENAYDGALLGDACRAAPASYRAASCAALP